MSIVHRTRHRSFGTLLAFIAGSASTAACGNGVADSSNTRDGAGTTSEPTSAGVSTALALACAAPSENCPCNDDGLTVQCSGPKIHAGNYTSCLPGVRVCMSGTWGACVSRALYQDVDAVTQDYTSACSAGAHVRWGALTIEGETPEGSQIVVGVQTADTEAALDAAPAQLVGAFDGAVTSPWNGIDVGAALAHDAIASGQQLRVTLRLVRASSSSASPAIMAFQQASQCVAN